VKIIAFILLLLVGFFSIQPLLSSQSTVAKMKCCSKTMKCHKKKQSASNPCENNACNPFMACAYGNFYLAEKTVFEFTALLINAGRLAPVNDNRLSETLSDCWHPPRSQALQLS